SSKARRLASASQCHASASPMRMMRSRRASETSPARSRCAMSARRGTAWPPPGPELAHVRKALPRPRASGSTWIAFPAASRMQRAMRFWIPFAAALAAGAVRADEPAYGPELEGFEYAFPVQRFEFESQRQKLHMSYLDVRPGAPNG